MPPLPTPEAWAQVRHEYENTRRPIEDICLAHGISANTLRRRVKAWGWTMRRPPILMDEAAGLLCPQTLPLPKPVDRAEFAAMGPRLGGDDNIGAGANGAFSPDGEPSPHIGEMASLRTPGEPLQAAAARVLRAIETTSARLTAQPAHLRETEMMARALGSLTRTLRDLTEFLDRHPSKIDDDPPPDNIDDFRNELARRLRVVLESHEADISAKYEAAWTEFAAEAERA